MDRPQLASLPLIESACPHVGILSFDLELPATVQLRPGLDPARLAREIDGRVVSAFVRARKPETAAACCGPTCCG